MRKETLLSIVLLAAAFLIACEITQTTTPGAVDVNITQPAVDTTTGPEPPAPGASGTIELEPNAVSVAVGKNVNIKVVVKDENGQEVPSENISVNVIDKTILRLAEIDGRIVAFEGVAAGVTSVIVSASGLQTSLVATVTP